MCCCAGAYSFNHRIISGCIMENKISTKGVFFLLMTAFCWSLAGLFIRASHLSGLGFSMMSSIVAKMQDYIPSRISSWKVSLQADIDKHHEFM